MENINYHRTKPVREFDLNQTLYSTIEEVAKANSQLEAIGYLGATTTYGELRSNWNRLADAYAKAGIKEGDAVGIATINMPIVQENLIGLSKLGATSCWIDLRLKPKDLINKINETRPKIKKLVIFEGVTPIIQEIINETDIEQVIIASPKDYLNPIIRILALLKDKKEGKQIILPDDKRFVKYKDFIKTGSKNSTIQPVAFEKERPSIIVQSSGSTGISKSIIHTEYNFNSAMQKEAYTDLPFAIGKTIYVAVPPFIIYGLNNSVYASLAFGMKAEMTPYVTESTVFDDLGKYDFACAAPLHYRYIYNKIFELEERIQKLEKEDSRVAKKELSEALKELASIMKKLSRVEVFISGGDKITAQELLTMQHKFATPIINGYGNNEMAGAAIISPMYANKPDSIGVPMRGIKVATFDPETGVELEQGQSGELCMTCDNMFVKYVNNEEETRKIKQIHEDGSEWIHTGDLGYVDEDGYVFVSGRSKRLIKRAAFKISPSTIENLIITMSEVKDCVVVGVPDSEDLEVPMLFIELTDENIDKHEEIVNKALELCSLELPEYEIPKYVQVIDKIPYHNNKQAFKELEMLGAEYVKTIENSSTTLKKENNLK